MAGYDLTGKILGDFIVNRVDRLDSSKHKIWECECQHCGKVHYIRSTELINGTRRNCSNCIGNKAKRVSVDVNVQKDKDTISKNLYDCENITLIDENILNVPIYFKIAQAINADLTFSPKGLTGLLDKYFNIKLQLEDYCNIEWEVGDIISTGSIYNLLTKRDRNDFVTYDNLETCLKKLKDHCIMDNVKHLAIPKIGCGRDKLDFDIVVSLICSTFGDTDIQVCVFGDYSNDPEYDAEYIDYLLEQQN